MKVLLVNPNREHAPEPVPPLGLCQVATAAEQAGHDVRLLDLCFARSPGRALAGALREHRPDAVGMTVRNVDNGDARSPRFYLDDIRALSDQILAATGRPPILGGAGLTMDPERVMGFLGADTAVVGAGEDTFVRLLSFLDGTGPLPDGVARLGHGGLFLKGSPVPSMRFERARLHRWLDLPTYFRQGAAAPVQTRRGCPMACVYCNYPVIEGERVLARPAEEVADEVADAIAAGARWVDFADGVFNRPRSHAVQICEALLKRGLRAYLKSSITPAGLDRGLALLMRQAGFAAAFCSPDAAHPATLRSYGKGFDRAELERAVDAMSAASIPTMFCFILGGPGETTETLTETLRFAREVCGPPHVAMIATRMRVYPDTPLAHRAGAAPLRPDPSAFFLEEGLDPEAVDAAARAAARHAPHLLYMDSGRGPLATWMRRGAALLGLGLPSFAVVSHLLARRRDRGNGSATS